MINSNALSLFLLNHDQNGVFNHNLRSIQYLMRSDEPNGTKFKHVHADSTNIALLTKRATPGNIQVTFDHAPVGNKYFGETVTAFDITLSLESPVVVSINTKRAFDSAGEHIRLPVTEVLLCAAVGNIARLKNLRDWALLNAVPLPPFLMEAAILDGKTSSAELIKIFTAKIVEHGSEAAANTPEKEVK